MTNIILFRAQPFHSGHLHMIKKALEDSKRDNNRLYVFVGSADKVGTKRNPLSIDLRLDLIKGSLKDEIKDNYLFNPNTNIIPLRDLSDEANNSVSWGEYLYDEIKKVVKDDYITFYYSDKPEIILSWFAGTLRERISFKFIPRYDDYSATNVRDLIAAGFDLKGTVPNYVYEHIDIIKKYISEAK